MAVSCVAWRLCRENVLLKALFSSISARLLLSGEKLERGGKQIFLEGGGVIATVFVDFAAKCIASYDVRQFFVKCIKFSFSMHFSF